MAFPVTGPFRLNQTHLGPPTSLGYRPQRAKEDRHWFRQRRPWDTPLYYWYSRREALAHNEGNGIVGSTNSGYAEYTTTPSWIDADVPTRDRARTKLKERLGTTAALAVSVAERKQAMTMMTSRITQLLKFTNALRKGRFGDAAKTLRVGMPPNKGFDRFEESTRFTGLRKGAKYFANNYLEFHFGWSPLVQDCYNAMEILSDGIPPVMVRASAKKTFESSTLTKTGSYPTWNTLRVNTTAKHQVTVRTQVQVSNPNLHLAAQLGVVNPATVAFELVPFSFVLDWFVTCSEFLESFNEFAGLALTNSSYTEFVTWNRSDQQLFYYNQANPFNGMSSGSYTGYRNSVWNGVYVQRYVGLPPGPTLSIRSPWAVSPRRGLAAISLLIQALK